MVRANPGVLQLGRRPASSLSLSPTGQGTAGAAAALQTPPQNRDGVSLGLSGLDPKV